MLSVLIPAFNYSPAALVEVLHTQAEKLNVPVEIVVCDDGSQPPLHSTPHSKLVRNPQNLGRMATRKRLIEEAKFDHLLFLDADVMPVSLDFLKTYTREADSNVQILSGGCIYPKEKPMGCELRWKYGQYREALPLARRSKYPYKSFISANYLIKKSIAHEMHNRLKINTYGSDLWIGQYFQSLKTNIKHIDNPVLHLGLESNVFFLDKSIQALLTLAELIKTNPKQLQSKMGNYYLLAKKWHILFGVRLIFSLFAKPMQSNLLGKQPFLWVFDLYRLGYLCQILKK